MNQNIRYACPSCGRRIRSKPELAGQSVTCSVCGATFIEPTDPLPGKEAEKKPPPLPDKPADYSLALMSGPDGQTMAELFEAHVIPDTPKPQAPANTNAWPPGMGPPRTGPAQSAAPTRAPAPPVPPRPGNAPPASVMPPGPTNSAPTPYMLDAKPGQKPPATPNQAGMNPGSSGIRKQPIPAPGLAGVTAQQMIDELGRRGLVSILVLYDFSEEDSAQMLHTQHLSTTQAVSLLSEYLLKLHQSGGTEEAKAGVLSAMKRLWSGDEDFLEAATRLWNQREAAKGTNQGPK